MTDKINCPICGTEVEQTYYSSEWGTEEEYYHCGHCNYAYEFTYGTYYTMIDGEEFAYSYKDFDTDLYKQVVHAYNKAKKKYNQ